MPQYRALRRRQISRGGLLAQLPLQFAVQRMQFSGKAGCVDRLGCCLALAHDAGLANMKEIQRQTSYCQSRHCEPTGRANARPMTGSAKRSRATSEPWIASSQVLLAMTVSTSAPAAAPPSGGSAGPRSGRRPSADGANSATSRWSAGSSAARSGWRTIRRLRSRGRTRAAARWWRGRRPSSRRGSAASSRPRSGCRVRNAARRPGPVSTLVRLFGRTGSASGISASARTAISRLRAIG